jgi:Spy/CpxP family protein refolding chaperone
MMMGTALAVAQPGVPAAPIAPAPPAAGPSPQAPRAPQAMPVPAMPPQAPQPPQPPRLFRDHRPPMEQALRAPAPGRWWHDSHLVEKLGLTPDQQKKMDDIFQQHRLRLIDLNAALQKEETIMEPLVGAEQPDESKILAQIDRVAQARAELEKANARMLLGIRRALTQDQWKKLQTPEPKGPPPGQPRPKRAV